MPVVWNPDCALHDPDGEVWLGVWEPGTEVAGRTTALLEALTEAGARIDAGNPHGDQPILAVHDREFVEHLATIWDAWVAAGFPDVHGRRRVVPYVFPTPGLLGDSPLRSPAALHGRLGRFCYDTMTLVGPGTWTAARAAADAALTAAELVLAGDRCAYALCRPPGHHVSATAYGGSCYLNNAAIAAQFLRDAGVASVAVLDIDAHHGNGTQSIFYDRPDVYFGSVHVDPEAGWFPHYLGFAEEVGRGAGRGANRNVPLSPRTGDEGWLAAIESVCEGARDRGAEVIILSLGLDACASDPESPLEVSAEGYRQGCELVGSLAPTVVVQEGGYDLAVLGEFAVAALLGVRAGSDRAHSP